HRDSVFVVVLESLMNLRRGEKPRLKVSEVTGRGQRLVTDQLADRHPARRRVVPSARGGHEPRNLPLHVVERRDGALQRVPKDRRHEWTAREPIGQRVGNVSMNEWVAVDPGQLFLAALGRVLALEGEDLGRGEPGGEKLP